MATDLIATCPVCRDVHKATRVSSTHVLLREASSWCPSVRIRVDRGHGIQYGQQMIVARVDGGDPGDEQVEARR